MAKMQIQISRDNQADLQRTAALNTRSVTQEANHIIKLYYDAVQASTGSQTAETPSRIATSPRKR
jgi:hypothetical protein